MQLRVLLAVLGGLNESSTVKATLKSPETDGVPEKVPLVESDRPDGNPLAIQK